MFKRGNRKLLAFLISIAVYTLLMLVVVLTKQIEKVNLESFSPKLAFGIMAISGAFYAGNYLVHRTTQNDKGTTNE